MMLPSTLFPKPRKYTSWPGRAVGSGRKKERVSGGRERGREEGGRGRGSGRGRVSGSGIGRGREGKRERQRERDREVSSPPFSMKVRHSFPLKRPLREVILRADNLVGKALQPQGMRTALTELWRA